MTLYRNPSQSSLQIGCNAEKWTGSYCVNSGWQKKMKALLRGTGLRMASHVHDLMFPVLRVNLVDRKSFESCSDQGQWQIWSFLLRMRTEETPRSNRQNSIFRGKTRGNKRNKHHLHILCIYFCRTAHGYWDREMQSVMSRIR